MKRFLYFLKSTKWVSRILFLLWIVFSSFANFPNESRLQIVLEFGAFFLVPALLIEIFKNPALKKQQSDVTGETTIGFGAKIKKLLFPFRWVYTLLVAMWVYGSFFSAFSKSDGVLSGMVIYGIIFIAPVIILEIVLYAKKNRKASEHTAKNINPDRYISPRRIVGLILLPLAVLFVIIGVSANANPDTYNPNNMYPGITFGAIGLVLLLSSINDPKTKTELAERKEAKREQERQRLRAIAYRGVYLSEEQIQKLESKTELPIVQTPVFLSAGEVAVYHSVAKLQETKHRVVGRTGSYSGGSVRIAKGLSVRTGSSYSRPVYGDVSTHYEGEVVLTNQRIVFLNAQKGFEVAYSAITAATAYTDGLSIQSRNHTYTLLLPKTDLAVTVFDAVRTGEIPIAGTENDGYDSYCDDEEYEESVIDDVSAVDGMEGHEFEYFCADLLRKNGFSEVSVTRGSGDQGVDVLATKGGIKYAIQCKNYASPLSNTPVQEVSAGKIFYNCHVGVVLTNSTFTPGAVSLAQATGVLLWDRNTLAELMSNSQGAVSATQETAAEVAAIPQQPRAEQSASSGAAPAVSTPQETAKHKLAPFPKQEKHIQIDGIDIDVDVASADRFGIVLDNFGIEIDEDDDDQIELLFDIVSTNGRSIRCDMDIVCNLYAGSRKVTTERETVYKDSFDGRDSVSVYFDKKNIAKTATRIELFCQKW